jgi:hypothetical protein
MPFRSVIGPSAKGHLMTDAEYALKCQTVTAAKPLGRAKSTILPKFSNNAAYATEETV